MQQKSLWLGLALLILIFGYTEWSKPQEKTLDQYSESNNAKIETLPESENKPKETQQKPMTNNPKVELKTNMGSITLELYQGDAPKTVKNFLDLTQKGYYDGLTFHRVISGFMIQGGDPNCTPGRGDGPCGAGGPGYRFEDELNPATPSYQAGYQKGVLAMANAGPNTNGSQFFIMHQTVPLPKNYSIFGKVLSGQEIVDLIATSKTDPGDRPLSPITIEKATLLAD